MNVQGNIVRETKLNGHKTKLNISELSAGIYVMILQSKEHSQRVKIVVE